MQRHTCRAIMAACTLVVLTCGTKVRAYNHTPVGHGAKACLLCHEDVESYMDTPHAKMVQGPPTAQETPVLTTIIDDQQVSIFDSRTQGYDTYVAPWADYFNEDNVEYTIGSKWKQRFMTKIVPETVDGANYSGMVRLADDDYVVMGIMWNVREQRWEDYHGPTGPNNWYTADRLTRRQCGGCHTTLFNPETDAWADKNSSFMQKGVSCESCHRPAVGGDVFRNPRKLRFIQQFELCGACHGRGSSVAADGVSPGRYGFPYSEARGRTYGIGDRLSDFYIQTTSPSSFWPNGPGGTNGNSKQHHQQYNDALLSKHFDAEVGCIDCHNVHDTENPHHTRLPGNELCTSCHVDLADPNEYRLHSGHYPDVATCVDCHMPYTAKTINPFDIRSHTFKIIAPSTTVGTGGDPKGFSGPFDASHVPNSCNSSCHNGAGPGPVKTNQIAQLGLNYIRILNGHALPGDSNGDGIVDFADFLSFSDGWMEQADWFTP